MNYKSYFPAPGIDITPEGLLNIAATRYNVSVGDIKSKIRRQPIVEARQYCAFLLRDNTTMTLQSIGNFMNIDHATVLHSCRVIKERIEFNQLLIN